METAKANKVHLEILHFEHENWVKQLKFYKDELTTYNNRLEDIAKRYTGMDVLAELEKFQNKFIRENEVIDTLMHDISGHEGILVESVKENPVASDHRFFNDHEELRNRMETFLKVYNELKPSFMRFLSK